jgi:hypothetical protein
MVNVACVTSVRGKRATKTVNIVFIAKISSLLNRSMSNLPSLASGRTLPATTGAPALTGLRGWAAETRRRSGRARTLSSAEPGEFRKQTYYVLERTHQVI